MATEQGSPRNEPHAGVVTEAVHFALFFTVEQGVLVLHADELGPAILLSDELHACKLGCPHAGGADVADFSGENQVVQRAHGLFDGHGVVESVDLEEVDILQIQTGEGSIDRGEDCLTRET